MSEQQLKGNNIMIMCNEAVKKALETYFNEHIFVKEIKISAVKCETLEVIFTDDPITDE